MAAPVFTPLTERLYESLPETYRHLDGFQPGDFPLKRYLSLLGDQTNDLEVLIDRLNYVGPYEGGVPGDTSELVDPQTADNGWLDWLGQLVGVALDPALTEPERRDAVEDAPSGWQAGNKGAMAAAAKTVLTGTRYAKVYDHSTDVSVIGAATIWDVLVVTRTSETPDPAAVLATIIAKNAKPAGVKLYHRDYEATWDDVEGEYPTWADWHAAGSWAAIQEAGL